MKNASPLKGILKTYVDQYQMKGKLSQVKLMEHWPEIAGKHIDKYTEELRIQDNKLFLKLTSAALKNELMYNREKMVSLVNEFFGENLIKEIIIR